MLNKHTKKIDFAALVRSFNLLSMVVGLTFGAVPQGINTTIEIQNVLTGASVTVTVNSTESLLGQLRREHGLYWAELMDLNDRIIQDHETPATLQLTESATLKFFMDPVGWFYKISKINQLMQKPNRFAIITDAGGRDFLTTIDSLMSYEHNRAVAPIIRPVLQSFQALFIPENEADLEAIITGWINTQITQHDPEIVRSIAYTLTTLLYYRCKND